jgi:hypothetical protein
MTSIPDMDPSRPLVSVSAGFGNQWLQEIQRALTTQFPNIGQAAVTPTAAQLNTVTGIDTGTTLEDRLARIELELYSQEIPAEAHDFNDIWWTLSSVAVPGLSWHAGGRRDSFSNVPWEWGSNLAPGTESDHTVVLISRRNAETPTWQAFQSVVVLFAGNDARQYWRANLNMQQITSSPWVSVELTEMSTTEGTSGDALSSTMCDHIGICG